MVLAPPLPLKEALVVKGVLCLSVSGSCRVFTSTTGTAWTPGCCCSTPVLCANAASWVSAHLFSVHRLPVWTGFKTHSCPPVQSAGTANDGSASWLRPHSSTWFLLFSALLQTELTSTTSCFQPWIMGTNRDTRRRRYRRYLQNWTRLWKCGFNV